MKLTFALMLLGYFALHSVLANQQVKQFLQTNIIPSSYYRIFFNVCSLVFLMPIFYLYNQIEPVLLFKAPIWFTAASSLVVVLGFVLLILAFRQYDLKEFSGLDSLQRETKSTPNTLQKNGFNAFVRHPLYFATLLIFWSLFFAQPSDVLLILAVIISVYIYIGTKLEEQKLVAEFGSPYLTYQKEVPMLLPSFSTKKILTKEIEKENTEKEKQV